MTKFTVTHSCGHEGTHAFSGRPEDRAMRENWLRRQPCQQCWRSQQQGAATSQTQAWNLPPLQGTAEDIGWAEVLRLKAVAHNRDYHAELMAQDRFREDPEMLQAIVASADAALAELQAQQDAAWWVENRFEALTMVKKRVVAAVQAVLDTQAQE